MVVEAHNLTKRYGDNLACNNICLSLEEGQVFGLLGPNGAGKSTLVKMLLGLVYPTAGEAYIKGKSIYDLETKRNTGYLPELFRLYEWLTAWEFLRFSARVYEIPAREEMHAITEVLEVVGLQGREKEQVKNYSKGMQQRLALAAAIIHKPAILFLDEPTSALDPLGRIEVRDIIERLRNQGTTIFLNSHLLSEVEMTCTHLGFINNGKILDQGPMNDFLSSQHELLIEVTDINDNIYSYLVNKNILLGYDKNCLLLQVNSRDEVPQLVRELVMQGVDILKVDVRSKGLEEIYINMLDKKGEIKCSI